jgi:hypothetical protein
MKILIGCPTSERYEYCIDLWLESVKKIIEFSKKKGIKADYLLVDNSKSEDFYNKLKKEGINIERTECLDDVKERIVNSRNLLRERVIEKNYDYFFSLEQDVIPEKDIIEKLIFSDKEIVSAYYGKLADLKVQDAETGEIKDITIELPVAYIQNGEGVRRANPNEVLNRGIIDVGGFGLGCLMISKKVMEKIKFRSEKGKAAFDDLLFCFDSKKLGYKLYLNSDARVEHLHKVW